MTDPTDAVYALAWNAHLTASQLSLKIGKGGKVGIARYHIKAAIAILQAALEEREANPADVYFEAMEDAT